MEQLALDIEADTKPAPWDWLVHIFKDKFGDAHLPPFDLDNDTFGDISTFRGYHWRGADCNELSKNIYPGRKAGEKVLDQDCNGIFGITAKGNTYEDEFCSKSKRFGVAVIGDSAGAHFSIPEKYFNASMINGTTYHDLLQRAADELDIPHESGYTGNTKTNGYVRHSFYKFAREWNLCNHNDYQNIAVNGGDSGNTWGNIHALKRNQQNDYPLIMFL